jgi:hypothetical protein
VQLGTRWAVRTPAPERLPEPMRASVRAVEEELQAAGQDVAGWGWTLTYLEGRPIVDLDDGTRIRLVEGDAALITTVEFDTAQE